VADQHKVSPVIWIRTILDVLSLIYYNAVGDSCTDSPVGTEKSMPL
jgi:hypothetical protein